MTTKTSFFALSRGDIVSYYGNQWRIMAIYNDGFMTVKDELTGESVEVHCDELD